MTLRVISLVRLLLLPYGTVLGRDLRKLLCRFAHLFPLHLVHKVNATASRLVV